jgi:hypothetical protein
MRLGLKLIGFSLLSCSTPAFAQEALWEFVKQFGRDNICSLRNYTKVNGRVSPANSDERIRLYIRCEARGGWDEFTTNSCCDHLNAADGQRIGVCPDANPAVAVPIREGVARAIDCN